MNEIADFRRKGTACLRRGRFSERNRIYHVITSTAERRPYFDSLAAARFLVKALRTEQENHHATTLTFVVMPDHLHWLVELNGKRTLSKSVNAIKSGSAREINRLLGRTGQFWQKGFYDRAIRYDDDLVTAARYIVANPLRAGIVKSIRDYPHWDAIWL